MNDRQREILRSRLQNEKEILKKLREIYRQAERDIDAKIAELLARTDTENLPSIIYQLDYQKALKKQIGAILDELNANQFKSISEYLAAAYENGFIGTLYDIQGQGVPLIFPIDQDEVTRAIIHDTRLSNPLYTKLGKDIQELKKRIQAELSRGISQGFSYADISRNLHTVTQIGYGKAMRIAWTEGHRIANEATYDVQKRAKANGADIVKQWDSTLDNKTRPMHRQLDGQVRELDDPFEVNGYTAQYPGGFGIAKMDIHCRCAMLQRARWALEQEDGEGFTKFDNFSKTIEEFDSRHTYNTFKKSFWSKENTSYMNYVQTLEERYETKNFKRILELMTDREYAHYSKLLKANPIYKGVVE